MVTGIYIPQNEILPVQRTTLNGTADYHYAVGRPIGIIALDVPEMMLIVHAAWKYPRMQLNRRATQLCWLHNPLLRGQALVGGDAVLVGPPTDDDQVSDVPADFAEFILDTTRFEVEHRTVGSPQWPVHRRAFSDYFSAALYTIDLIAAAKRSGETRIIAGTEASS